jgi:hypothetical protein
MKKFIHSTILAALLLLCSGIAMGQSFTILQPSPKQLHFIQPVNAYFMESITIQNNTNTKLSLTAALSGSSLLQIRMGSSFTVAPNATTTASFQLWQSGSGCSGDYTGALNITDMNSSTSDQITLTGEIRSYAITGDQTGRQTLCFDQIPVGTKACRTVWAKNSLTEPIIISAFGFAYGGESQLTATAHGTKLPIVILPGEEMPIADVYYAPTAVNSSEFQWLTVTRTPGGNGSPDGDGTSVDIRASSALDTNLLKPCLVASVDTSFVGPILFGGSIDKTINLRNNRYSSITVSGVDFSFGDLSEFSIVDNPFPLTIGATSSQNVTLRFSPAQADTIVKYRYAVGLKFNTPNDSTATIRDCGSSSLAFAGLAMVPTADSISTPLFPDKEYDLGMTGTSPSFSQDFHFDNNTSGKIKVTAVSLANSASEFSITNITPSNSLPFTLDVGDKMTVTVQFTPSALNQVFFNQLVITTENGLKSQTFPLQAMRQSTSKVSTFINGIASLNLNPNPVKDRMTISLVNAEPASIEIYNLLGERMFKMEHVTELSLNTRDLKLQSGIYFVRATGREATGMNFTLTKKLIVE